MSRDLAVGSAPGGSTLSDFLKDLSCRADAVVVAEPKTKSSHLIEGQDFVFTDYDMSVQEVIKNNMATPNQAGNQLTITRPGGTIQLDGHGVMAIDVSFQPFKADKEYLLFLSYIPSTAAYKALNSTSSFQLDDKVTLLTTEPLPVERKIDDPTAFLTEVRAAVTSGCK